MTASEWSDGTTFAGRAADWAKMHPGWRQAAWRMADLYDKTAEVAVRLDQVHWQLAQVAATEFAEGESALVVGAAIGLRRELELLEAVRVGELTVERAEALLTEAGGSRAERALTLVRS